MSQVHARARTTPRTCAEIKASSAPHVELAERRSISRATAAKWKGRETPQDLSHRPLKLNITLTPAQEAIAVELRCMALLALGDLLVVVREFINPDVSRSGLDRCLRRHSVATCAPMNPRRARMGVKSRPRPRPTLFWGWRTSAHCSPRTDP